MPYKFNSTRRDKFETAKYRVTNWSDYNEALRRRGDLTIWFDADAVTKWTAPRRASRGGQAKYSDFAIEICLALRLVFHQPRRQVQGLVRSLMRMLGLSLPAPDFSTLSRRSKSLNVAPNPSKSKGPITLIIDSTGLKIHRGSDWHEAKHARKKAHKNWRKLHLAMDQDSGEIVASLLTTDAIGDETALPDLVAGLELSVARVLADGAYDGTGVFTCLTEKFGPEIEVVIPPPISAVLGLYDQRDAHIDGIAKQGRMTWQAETGYNARALVEAQIGRWKTIIGDRLKSRSFDRQATEIRIATKALNRMTELGRAKFQRV